MRFISSLSLAITNDWQRQKEVLLLGFYSAFTILLAMEVNAPLLADTSLTLIPSSGDVADAFRTGNFDFQTFLLFGMHLIRLGGIISGVVYMIMNVYAGFRYILGASVGDKDTGRTIMLNAFLGFGLAVFSWIIVDVFIAFLLA